MTQTKVCPTPPTPVSVVGTSNHAMVLISYACVGLTGVISLILILMHLFSFSAPKEQRQIIRIALVPLVTVAISCASIVAYDVSPYIKPIADLYEAFALASLFLLFVQFSVPSGTFGQELFDSMARAAAMDGDHRWAKMKWVFAFQFPIVETVVLIVTEITLVTGSYCEGSLSIHFANLWLTIIRTASTILAVVAALKLYKSTKVLMKSKRALSKLVCFKIIVALNVIQSWVFKALLEHGVLKTSSTWSYADFEYGLPAVVICIESVLFALSFHYAYAVGQYRGKPQSMGVLAAIFSALNPTDLLKGMFRAVGLLLSRGDSTDYYVEGSGPSSRLVKMYDTGNNGRMSGVETHAHSMA